MILHAIAEPRSAIIASTSLSEKDGPSGIPGIAVTVEITYRVKSETDYAE